MGCFGSLLANLLTGCLFGFVGLAAQIAYRLARLVNTRRAVVAILLTAGILVLWRWSRRLTIPDDPKVMFLMAAAAVTTVLYAVSKKDRIARFLAPVLKATQGETVSGTVRGALRREVQRRGFLHDYAEHILELKLEVTPGDYYHVEMRGRDIVGAVEVGDAVDVTGRIDPRNTLRARRITNHSRHCVVLPRWI
ncbi:MAG TPA: hypothetical protein VM537_02155 [Anaerolineae bacterium]|nr:hypothetical protein [Anaerolineae bacterium]